VSPLRWDYEDSATPWMGDSCSGHDLNGDGYLDLVFKFSNQEMVSILGLKGTGFTIPVILKGNLKEEFGGTGIVGRDCVIEGPPFTIKLVKIGVTSGDSNALSRVTLITKYAEEKINQYCIDNKWKIRFEFIILNNHGSDSVANDNIVNFYDQGIFMVVGHDWSSQCRASLDLSIIDQMIMLSPSSTDPSLGENRDHIGDALYRLAPDEIIQSRAIAALINYHSIEILNLYYGPTLWRDAIANAIIGFSGEYSYSVPDGQSYEIKPLFIPSQLSTINTNLAGLSNAGVGLIDFEWANVRDVLQELSVGGYPNLDNIIWFGSEASSHDDYYDLFVSLITDIKLYNPSFAIPETAEFDELETLLNNKFGYIEPYDSTRYDCCWAMASAAIDAKKIEVETVKDELETLLVAYPGLSGTITINEFGDRNGGDFDIWGWALGGVYHQYGKYLWDTDTIDWYGDP
jgi:hypothetical protein